MATLTTPARVRNRIKVKEADIGNEIINEFIEDVQANIEAYAERAFAESDSLFGVARAICTDRAACKALIHLLNIPEAGISYEIDELKVDKSDPAANKVALLKMIWARANARLYLLKPKVTLKPKSSTA